MDELHSVSHLLESLCSDIRFGKNKLQEII